MASTRAAAPPRMGERPAWLDQDADGDVPAAPEGGQSDTRKPAPTDDELAQRWLQDHPDTAWGLGEFRRYRDGVWPVVAADIVRAEMLQTLKAAKRPVAG